MDVTSSSVSVFDKGGKKVPAVAVMFSVIKFFQKISNGVSVLPFYLLDHSSLYTSLQPLNLSSLLQLTFLAVSYGKAGH